MDKLKALIKKCYAYYPTFLTLAAAFFAAAYLYHIHGNPLLAPATAQTAGIQADSLDSADFEAYLKELFQSEAALDTLSLHYTLSDPSSYGITDTPITFGAVSAESEAKRLAELENIQDELKRYEPSGFPLDDQVTYAVLSDYVKRQLDAAPYYYYHELLTSTNGVQAEYPILLVEYDFQSEQDIKDYLKLLKQFDTHFDDICRFEQEKAKKGLFMSEASAKNLITQCQAFIPEDIENSFWETTFSERLDGVSNLSDQKKAAYKVKNHKILAKHVYPSYRHLIAVIKALQHAGKNSQGLMYYKNGKAYYELLVKNTTGSSHSVTELKSMIEARRNSCLLSLSKLPVLQSSSSEILEKTPEEMLEYLKVQIKEDFPALPDTNYTVRHVSEGLYDFLSPAFYLTAPIDDYTDNLIYLNPGYQYEGIDLFTTLAHEGYPGHLYQTVYAYTKNLPDIRFLLYHGGYIEGWATYVEMRSYDYAGLEQNFSRALRLNQETILSLYATADIGIHYEGWSLSDTIHFLSGYGITDASAVSKMYQAIIENPANYLKYYIGYLEFLELKASLKQAYGTNFSEKKYHAAVLDIGTAPFYIIEKYIFKYYEAAN